MIKRISIVSILSLALLLTLTVSLVAAQQGTTGRAPEANAPEELTSHSDFIPIQGRLTDASGNPLNGTYLVDFKIYEHYSGDTALCEDLDNEIQVENGLFSSYMAGCNAIDGRQLFLGITVNDDPEMTPRQYIDNVPYAWTLRPGAVISDFIGPGPILHLENWDPTGRGLRAYAMSQTGTNYGVVGASRSPDGFGGYFYNNGAGIALKVNSSDGLGLLATSVSDNAISASSTDGMGLYAYSENDIALWATSINSAGIHGAGGQGPGVEGFSVLGPGVYGESLTGGVAIAANGAITSTAPTYLWISGSDVLPFDHNNTTIIDLNSHGGASIMRGARTDFQSVVLPITIPGTLYGQDVKLTELNLYWQGDTSFDSIVTIRLRRQNGVCNNCYVEIKADTADYTCVAGDHPQGCVISLPLTTNNYLSPTSGVLYLTLELGFESNVSWIDFGGARLTLEYDN